jgi:hypothetical protein
MDDVTTKICLAKGGDVHIDNVSTETLLELLSYIKMPSCYKSLTVYRNDAGVVSLKMNSGIVTSTSSEENPP